MPTRTAFEQELFELHEKVKNMGILVEKTYDQLFDAARKKDQTTIENIMKKDRAVNDMQRTIEASCLSLITKQQPIAGDLRLVTAALKAVTDMERIGDHCADIAELILRLKMVDMDQFSEHLPEMIEETKAMEHIAVDCLVNRDIVAAERVILQDDVVDDLFNKVKEELIEDLKEEAVVADICVDVLMIAKYLEKIGDHAVNIAEWEIFQETGKVHDKRLL